MQIAIADATLGGAAGASIFGLAESSRFTKPSAMQCNGSRMRGVHPLHSQ
jgi:hypothetical protein